MNSQSAEWILKHQMMTSGLPTPSYLGTQLCCLRALILYIVRVKDESPNTGVPRCLETGRGAYLSPTTVWSTCPPDFMIHLHASGRVIWNNPHLIKKHSSEILKLVNVKVPSFLQQPSKINYWHLPCSWSFTEKSPSCQFISAKPLFKIQWII